MIEIETSFWMEMAAFSVYLLIVALVVLHHEWSKRKKLQEKLDDFRDVGGRR